MSRIYSTDQTLIDRLSLNDTEAFEELYRRYWNSLYLYCLKKLLTPEDAKIIVRNLFIDIWEKRHSLSVSFSLSKYLYEEVRKTVVKCLSQKLSTENNLAYIETRLETEFSVQSLKAAMKPVTKRYAVINKPSELIKQQTGQTGVVPHNIFATVKWMLHSFTHKFSLNNLLSYPKN